LLLVLKYTTHIFEFPLIFWHIRHKTKTYHTQGLQCLIDSQI
jgi:hypothetical protein